jgi:hypothetical protein
MLWLESCDAGGCMSSSPNTRQSMGSSEPKSWFASTQNGGVGTRHRCPDRLRTEQRARAGAFSRTSKTQSFKVRAASAAVQGDAVTESGGGALAARRAKPADLVEALKRRGRS